MIWEEGLEHCVKIFYVPLRDPQRNAIFHKRCVVQDCGAVPVFHLSLCLAFDMQRVMALFQLPPVFEGL